MRKLIALVVVLVALATLAAHAQSSSSETTSAPTPPETIEMLLWRAKYERSTYQFVIEPRSPGASGQPTGRFAQIKGAKYHATITDIDGHVWEYSDDIRPDQWDYFQQHVLKYDPFGIVQGKATDPRAVLITLTVRTNLRTTTASFTFPPDSKHRRLIEFLQDSWPGQVENSMRGLPTNNSETGW